MVAAGAPPRPALPAVPSRPLSTLPFTSPFLLAPMEGVTDPLFRELVLARNPPEALGGTFTEFARVVGTHPLPVRTLALHLGTARFPQPVGLQLMGADAGALATSAERAFELGVAIVDLNFGCPSKGALRGCAGSALLDDPPAVERLVAAVRAVAGPRPVSAKLRAGGEDDARLEELVRAAEAGGAALITVHCRTRREGYRGPGDWERLRRAAAATTLPVCGNGGVERHADLARLLRETGCRLAMVGRAALGDPWLFSGRRVERDEAGAFLLEYAERQVRGGRSWKGAVGRVKQLLHHWRAGGLLGERAAEAEARRASWLREPDPTRLLGRIARRAGLDRGPGEAAEAIREAREIGEPARVPRA